MLFNSFVFLIGFLPPTLIVFWSLVHLGRPRFAIAWLALCSYAFYLAGERDYWWLIIASIAFNFAVALLIAQARAPGETRWWLTLGVAGNLGGLLYFKYFDFLETTAASLLHQPVSSVDLVIPLGISFFTFTQIAYLVDVYSRRAEDYDPISYALFVTFFPHLIAGPILHHREMMPQFARKNWGRFSDHVLPGMSMFAIGLFKKTIIADLAAPTATSLFNDAHANGEMGLFLAWTAAIAYAVQIYFDFSGYSDMAIGLARLFGIDLPINFNSPYKASSLIDFWRRWHITLSRFLRDYLYIPLGGNRRGSLRRFENMFCTMLLGGIWHGAGWTFVFWGGLHGAFLVANHLWKDLRGRLALPALPRPAAQALTLVCVIFAWVPFRAPDVATTVTIWAGMCGLHGAAAPDWPGIAQLARALHLPVVEVALGRSSMPPILLGVAVALFLPNSQQIMASFHVGRDTRGYPEAARLGVLALRQNLWWGMAMGLVLAVAMRAIGSYSEFIYFHF